MDRITILLVDDHKLFREALAFFLGGDSRFWVIGSTSSAEEALTIAINRRPQIAIVDINMSPFNGFELAAKMAVLSPGINILTVSIHALPAYLEKIFIAGAKGYVTKNSPQSELVEAIITVSGGHQFICHEMKEMLITKKKGSADLAIARLTKAELEIINMIRMGFSSPEIADRLRVSIKTIEAYRYKLFKKLNVKRVEALVDFVNTHGL